MDEEYLIKVNSFLLFVCLVGLVMIGFLVYHISNLNEDLNNEINTIKEEIPKCPECPKCELKCPENNDCPKCPDCPECPAHSSPGQPQYHPDCPSVDQIVQGIFPGRNPKIVEGTKYHRVDPSNIYDGLSTTNFYEKKYKFPMEKVLKPDEPPLRDYNLTGENTIDNSLLNNNNVSYSQKSKKMLKNNPVPANTHSEINYQESNNELNNNQ